MSCKRSYADQDPDYENDLSHDQKRLKVIEKDNKEATVRKIQQIVTAQFNHEAKLKEAEAKEIDDTFYQALKMIDQLRVSAVTSFYSFERPCEVAVVKTSGNQPPIHPTVKKYIGKRPTRASSSSSSSSCGPNLQLPPTKDSGPVLLNTSTVIKPSIEKDEKSFKNILLPLIASPPPALPLPPPPPSLTSLPTDDGSRGSRFKIKKRVVVGNVSKYIPLDKREESDQSTHKWMVYVRGPKEDPFIETFVKKVWFFLHPSYRPNDLVEVSHPPFHLTRRGWGEFPVRIQLHFHNDRNKRVDIVHKLKLDNTYTGLQTLGSETVVDVSILRTDLQFGDTAERHEKDNTINTHSPIIPHDIGGISIPADANGCALGAALKISQKSCLQPRNLSESFSVPDLEDTLNRQNDVEMIDENKKSPVYTAILPRNHLKMDIKQEVLEDSGEKFLTSFINDHGAYFNPAVSDSVHFKPPAAVFNHALNKDTSIQNALVSPFVKIKEEPLDEVEDMIISSMNVPAASGSSTVKEEICKNTDLEDIRQLVSANLNKCINESFAESKSDVPAIKNQDLKLPPNQHFDATSKINNLPVHIVAQKTPIPSNSANVSLKTPHNKLIPANSSNTLRLQSPGASAEPGKSEGQPQVGNGGPTFVKCMSKEGTLYLIPLAEFLKLNPSAPASILLNANAASSSSSLLKPVVKPQTTVNSFVNHGQNSLLSKAPFIDNHPATTSSNSMQQILLTSAKMSHISQMNNLSLLLPQNSTAGSQRIKVQLGGVGVGCPSSAKKMVSCLLKNRLVANNKPQPTNDTKEMPSLNMDIYETMDGIVRALVKMFPLFALSPDRILHPYCAPSLQSFLSWNIGKRHAAEWQRSRAIRNKIVQLIPNSTKWASTNIWPVKRLLLWCRHHGYSPMRIVDKDEECDDMDESKESASEDKFSTYTESTELLETINKEMELIGATGDEKEEEEIDILTVEAKPKLPIVPPSENLPVNRVFLLPSINGGAFVRETVEEIGLKLFPEEAYPDVMAPLAEDALLSAMKQFAEEILSNSVAEAFKSNGNKRCPSIITSVHVGNAIRDLPKYDFLTNNYLGTSIPKSHLSNMVNVKL